LKKVAVVVVAVAAAAAAFTNKRGTNGSGKYARVITATSTFAEKSS
jgi:hypothetical protein